MTIEDKAKLEKHGLRIGGIVTKKGEEYKVTYVNFLYGDKPGVTGVKKNKKCEWSQHETHLFDCWELK